MVSLAVWGEEAEGKEKPKEKLVRGEQRLVWRKMEWGAAKGKMAGAKMGVGSVCLWQREGKWPATGDEQRKKGILGG